MNLFKEIRNDLLKTVLEENNSSDDFSIRLYEGDEGSHYICNTCYKYLAKNRLPPMSAANELKVIKIDETELLPLTELENNLIAKKILFQKIFQLPKSRMSAIKDKLVNIPIGECDIMNTVEHFPRTPMEGGLLEVKLKRKIEYKNYH